MTTSLLLISRTRKSGFSLVELMVSMAVLSIMLIALASATSYVSRLFLNNVGAFDNFTKARVMLNVFDRDIQQMIMRRDLAAFVDSTSGGGKPACAFYTNVEGYPGTGTRSISLVNYQLQTTATSSVLNRQNYGMNFTTTSGTTPSVGISNVMTQLGTLSLQTESLSTGVIAFQWQFVDGNGAIQTPISTSTAFIYNYSNPGAATNYRTVVLSMVVLSSSAYNLAVQDGKLAQVTADFPSASTNLSATLPTYSQYWNSILNGATFDTSLPQPIRSGIEVIERHIPLPITTPSS